MVSASLYIIACSAKNRVVRRLRRLREPRYLVGAIVGTAYLYFTFFARVRGSRSGRARRGQPMPVPLAQAGGDLAAVALFVAAALAWLLPFSSGMLEFSDAEMDFLFTAPVSRRALLVHRLMRSQLGLLFTALVTSLVYPSALAGRMRWMVAMWVLLTTARVYFTGVTLTRARVRSTGNGQRRIALAPIAVVVIALAVVGTAIVRTFVTQPAAGFADVLGRLQAVVSSSESAAIVLWPFVALTRPLFAPWLAPYLIALASALLVLVVTFLWVLRTDEALQETATTAAAQRATQTQSRHAPAIRPRATGLTLAPTGRPENAFFWKNGVQTLRLGGVMVIRIVVAIVGVVTAATSIVLRAMHLRGGAAVVCSVAMTVAAFVAVLGPQVVRTDLRSDLRHIEVLKTWPIRAASVIRGEMLWPGSMLTGIGWLAIACALMLSTAAFPEVSPATRLAFAAGAALVLPAFVFAQYLVQNAAAVLFPAWVPLGNERPRGLDAMGQRLIMLGGVLLSVVALFLPAAIACAVAWFAFRRWLGVGAWVPAAIVCSTIVILEVLILTEALGPAYERLDILSVERAE